MIEFVDSNSLTSPKLLKKNFKFCKQDLTHLRISISSTIGFRPFRHSAVSVPCLEMKHFVCFLATCALIAQLLEARRNGDECFKINADGSGQWSPCNHELNEHRPAHVRQKKLSWKPKIAEIAIEPLNEKNWNLTHNNKPWALLFVNMTGILYSAIISSLLLIVNFSAPLNESAAHDNLFRKVTCTFAEALNSQLDCIQFLPWSQLWSCGRQFCKSDIAGNFSSSCIWQNYSEAIKPHSR